MLFNSYEFLFAFFPVAIAAYRLLGRSQDGRAAVLLAASIAFYASWDWRFLALLLPSILVNYALGTILRRSMASGRHASADAILVVGVTLNLLVLGVFKYAGFVVANVNTLAGTDYVLARIILPLGISFLTFEQIGFLIDLRRGHPYRLNLLRYAVFVAFFPRLVAGPILRFGEIVPQLQHEDRAPGLAADLAVGLSIFAIGLAKKALLADGISPFVAPSFDAAASGQHLDLFMAWGGALAYTCQLYFDFSGYSDMAIGAARCFGIRFPQNFNSPYKSASIIEFWRRWHMTLSRFLRDYLYIPLGGNRRGKIRRYVNLLITMVLGGLWHGANWTFLAWGALHGTYLMVNHAWDAAASRTRAVAAFRASRAGRGFGYVITFLAVVVAWVFFRAPTFHAGWAVLSGMAGMHGVMLPAAIADPLQPLAPVFAALGVRIGGSGAQFIDTWLWIAALLALAFLAPNTQEILARGHPTLEHPAHKPKRLRWSESPAWAVAAGLTAFLGVLSVTRGSVFLYWQF